MNAALVAWFVVPLCLSITCSLEGFYHRERNQLPGISVSIGQSADLRQRLWFRRVGASCMASVLPGVLLGRH